MIHRIDRRTFLALLAIAGGAAAASPLTVFGGKKVVVSVPVLLACPLPGTWRRTGHDVVVPKAQAIAGGRVKTIREPFRRV